MIDKLGKYEVNRLIGSGSYGSVYQAYDPFLDRTVAIKTIKQLNSDEALLKEARIAAKLNHQNITQIYDGDHTCDPPYIVMEYAPGSLEDLLKRETLGHHRTLYISIDIASGLAHAHTRNIIHRDIKPGNILISSDESAKVADFGLARASREAHSIGPYTFGGSPWYMAPEQWEEERVDGRTDIYALGIMLYEMCVGRVPFTGSIGKLHNSHMNDPLPPMKTIPEEIKEIITVATQKDPKKRYPDAIDMSNHLNTALSNVISSNTAPENSLSVPPDIGETDDIDEISYNDNGWGPGENDLIVRMYFEMLQKEINSTPFVKSSYYTDFAGYTGRSYKAAEYKMRNISAVLESKGLNWISGLRPASNVQRALAEEVEGYLLTNGYPQAQ